MPLLLGLLLWLTAFGSSVLLTQDQKKHEKELTREEKQTLQKKVTQLDLEGSGYHEQGQLTKAQSAFREALEIRRGLYRPTEFPQGHAEIARTLINLGIVFEEENKFVEAEEYYGAAVAMLQRLHPQGHPEVASNLSNLGIVLAQQGRYREAERHLRAALTMRERLYPLERYPRRHLSISHNHNNLAKILAQQGMYAEEEEHLRAALTLAQLWFPPAQYPNGHPEVAIILNNLGNALARQGRLVESERHYRDALVYWQRRAPERLPPQGQFEFAGMLNNLGTVLDRQGRKAEAVQHFRDALSFYLRLFPKDRFPSGHPELARCLLNLGETLGRQNQYTEAERHLRDALSVWQKLAPNHPEAALSLGSLSHVLVAQGKHAEAEQHLRTALALRQRLYRPEQCPQGHPELVGSLHDLGVVLTMQGQLIQGRKTLREALMMAQQLTERFARLRTEMESLTLLGQFPGPDGYLSLTRAAAPAETYADVWKNKAAVSRIFEARHFAQRAARSSPQACKLWEEMVALKRQREQLILAPQTPDPKTKQERVRLLQEWAEQIEKKESVLRPLLPAVTRAERLAKTTPTDFQSALLPGCAFVDILHYVSWDFDPEKSGKDSANPTPSYVAFLLTPSAIHRIELGPGAQIEKALDDWRLAITKRATNERQAAEQVRKLVWDKLTLHLPSDLVTIYISPDQKLSFLPWGALPGKNPDSVLLEERDFVLVPHGHWLLDRLTTEKQQTSASSLLALGGVIYNDAPAGAPMSLRVPEEVVAVNLKWKYLPGTEQELQAIERSAKTAGVPVLSLRGNAASVSALMNQLPQARLAHLATHGFFAEPKFRSVLQLDPELFRSQGHERIGAGAKNPLLLAGLVLAGANRPETPGRGIVTGDTLIDLDLSNLELVVLSACETGLGDVAGGEGVFNLQRSFHMAGCHNVIASLWKVGDAPTLVLMEEFYRNLWERKLSKREALRQAQLTVYRHPDRVYQRVKELASRGIEDDAVQLPPTALGSHRRSPPAWWAAFFLSGVGE